MNKKVNLTKDFEIFHLISSSVTFPGLEEVFFIFNCKIKEKISGRILLRNFVRNFQKKYVGFFWLIQNFSQHSHC
ncbi:unnamed protein product [Meloidogyne enterolobii]|uniref:Uncharacterized protein n=1 Tax=Meloidogyne enterolobii TaxID=390850 RepID=A0ACB0YAS8_MELEN